MFQHCMVQMTLIDIFIQLCVVQLRDGTLSDVKKTIEKFSKVLRTCM